MLTINKDSGTYRITNRFFTNPSKNLCAYRCQFIWSACFTVLLGVMIPMYVVAFCTVGWDATFVGLFGFYDTPYFSRELYETIRDSPALITSCTLALISWTLIVTACILFPVLYSLDVVRRSYDKISNKRGASNRGQPKKDANDVSNICKLIGVWIKCKRERICVPVEFVEREN